MLASPRAGRREMRLFSTTRTSGKRRARAGAIPPRHDHALFNPGPQIPGQALLQLVTRVGHQPGMDIAPVPFQVRIHSGKGTCHGSILLETNRVTSHVCNRKGPAARLRGGWPTKEAGQLDHTSFARREANRQDVVGAPTCPAFWRGHEARHKRSPRTQALPFKRKTAYSSRFFRWCSARSVNFYRTLLDRTAVTDAGVTELQRFRPGLFINR